MLARASAWLAYLPICTLRRVKSGHSLLRRMAKQSAGILAFKRKGDRLEVLLVHPGGPFWKNKESGAWSIPKGEPQEGEELLPAALRELREEIGLEPPGNLQELGTIQQKGGKTVHAWAVEVDPDTAVVQVSNSFELEWPPRSGTRQTFPEIDRAEFFSIEEAAIKVNQAQRPFLERLSVRML
jgi:predicted NUDIX family NTP pyrophosphohydrolase